MIKIVIKIDGMKCSMCQSHINDVIRNNFIVKKVKSSYKKGETVITSDKPLDKVALQNSIEKLGYKVISYSETK